MFQRAVTNSVQLVLIVIQKVHCFIHNTKEQTNLNIKVTLTEDIWQSAKGSLINI